MEVDWKQKAESDRDSIYDNLEAASKDAANGTDQKIAIGVADIASGLLSGHLVEGSTTVHRLVLSTGHSFCTRSSNRVSLSCESGASPVATAATS